METNRNVIPKDESTLFICSGMQNYKEEFQNPNGLKKSSLQSCIRTNDLEEVGDGSHLTYFEMLGNFSFGNNDYEESCHLWHNILGILKIKPSHITYHPSQEKHRLIWEKFGYSTIPEETNIWKDDNISGYCCEVFCEELEIGNLVHTGGHSVDIGFGWERLHMVTEQVDSVQKTSLFDQSLHPIVSDHSRSVEMLLDNGIFPDNKGRNYVCRKIVRRMIPFISDPNYFSFSDILNEEIEKRNNCMKNARKSYKKNKDKSSDWWKDTFGILPEELKQIKLEM